MSIGAAADQLIDWTNNRDGWGATSGSMQSYVYDAAGNRQSDSYQAWPGGGASWGTSNMQSWTANVLNELTTVQGPAPTPTPAPGPIHKPEGEQPPPPPPTTFSYDANGNTIGRVYSNGSGNGFEWDAANRLTAITYSGNTNRTEFTYDGLSRRVKIVEKTDGTVTSTKQFVWNGMRIAEERDGSNSVTRRYYSQGEERIGGSDAGIYYYTRDHLGSIRELSDPAGSLRARYDYDSFGNTTKVSGDLSVDFGYTGHYYHAASNLYLAPYRAYDSTIGRWLSRDPIAERGGLNLYGYVANDPSNSTDVLGLAKDAACVQRCDQQLQDCFSAANIVSYGFGGGAFGAAAQGLNMWGGMGAKPFSGGMSGTNTSWLRNWALRNGYGATGRYATPIGRAARWIGRLPTEGAAAIGTGAGLLGLHAKCWSEYAGCLSGCDGACGAP